MALEDLEQRILRLTDRKGEDTQDASEPPAQGNHIYEPPQMDLKRPADGGLLGILGLTGALVASFAVFSFFLGENDVSASTMIETSPAPRMAAQPGAPAWELLPAAPSGWIALTPDDAFEDPSDSVLALSARWPGGAEALRDLAVFPTVAMYLEDANRLAESETFGSTVYLHSTGQYIRADIEVLSAPATLGVESSHRERLSRLHPYLQERSRIIGVPMAVELGDFLALWQTTHTFGAAPADDFQPTGVMDAVLRWSLLNGTSQSLASDRLEIPFDPGSKRWSAFDLTVPLDANVVLTLRGVTSPWMVEEFLNQVDIAGIAARGALARGSLTPQPTPRANAIAGL